MSVKLSKLPVVAAVAAIAVTFYVFSQGGEEHGSPSTVEMKAGGSRLPASLKEEIFQFEKSASVNFDFSEEVIQQSFKGHLFMDWNSRSEAIVALSMPGHQSDVYIRARFNDSYELRCLEVPKNLTEAESDYVLLLKNLVLDYAYKTNRDDNGEYLAEVKTTELNDGTRTITKIKSKYLDPDKANLLVDKSHHEIKLGQTIVEARGEESFRLVFPDKANNTQKEASTRTSYKLTVVDSGKRPQINTDREFNDCSSDFSHQVKVVEKVSIPDFKNNLASLAGLDRGSRQDALRKILKALRSNPELLADFMDWANTVLDDRQLSALALGTLGNLGTPEAQKELVAIFNGATEKNKHLHFQVLNTFTLTEGALTSESREFLKGQLKDGSSSLAEGAAYALGSSIQNDPDSPESQKDLQFLMKGLDGSASAESKMVYLDAIGNSGSSEAVPVLQRHATSSDENIREKAIMGLRFTEHEGNGSIYMNALNDQSSRVRQAALEAIRLSPKQEMYAQVLSECASSSWDENLRNECRKAQEQ